MNPVDRRLIDLAIIGRYRPLTAMEAREWEESRQYAINREWKLARVINLMWMARRTCDWDWAAQLSREYDKVMKLYGEE